MVVITCLGIISLLPVVLVVLVVLVIKAGVERHGSLCTRSIRSHNGGDTRATPLREAFLV